MMAHLSLSQLVVLALTLCGLIMFGVSLLTVSLRVRPAPHGPVQRTVIPARRADIYARQTSAAVDREAASRSRAVSPAAPLVA